MKKPYNKRQFISQVKKGLPCNFSNFDTCFYTEPLGHIFSGVVADKAKDQTIRVMQFVFPLYEGFNNNQDEHIGFSQKITHPDCYILLDEYDDTKALAAEFLKRTKDVVADAHNYLELGQFYDYLNTGDFQNRPSVEQTLGYTQVLLGDAEKAVEHLNKAIDHEYGSEYPEFEQWKRMEQLLSDGKLDKAEQILLNNEKELKQNLGITPKAP